MREVPAPASRAATEPVLRGGAPIGTAAESPRGTGRQAPAPDGMGRPATAPDGTAPVAARRGSAPGGKPSGARPAPSRGVAASLEDLPSGEFDRLREQLDQYRAILDHASLGIALVREDRFDEVSPPLEEMLGYEPGALAGRHCELLWPSPDAYREAMAALAPRLAAGEQVDFEPMLARADGSRLLARVRARALGASGAPGSGTVLLFEDITEQRRSVDALARARADLEKRVKDRTQELAATNALLIAEIAERTAAERQVRHLAQHDVLTGLPNRRLLEERLAQALEVSRRDGRRSAVMFIDLDRFKPINDTLGHAVGDMLLKAVARRVSTGLRPGDTVARVGGDEFVLVLPDIGDADETSAVADRLLESLSQPYTIEQYVLRVTPSIGIAMYPEDGTDAVTLLARADAAMYHAKSLGRRNWQFFTEKLGSASSRRLQLENDLHGAIDRGELQLYYQPRFDMNDGRICAVEALLRWNHPKHGMVNPAEFVPLAEETGLILPVGEWALREACHAQRRMLDSDVARIPISVNLSAHQFHHPAIADVVRSAMTDSGIAAGMLELEITETTLMRHTEETLATLQTLVRLGAQIAIDDFGTGYSSLAYLKRFPVALLKIDRSFVRDLDTDPDDATIVRAIAGLAKSLGKRLVAEGVEQPGQIAFLRETGCDEGQGYLLSRPVPADVLAELLLQPPLSMPGFGREPAGAIEP